MFAGRREKLRCAASVWKSMRSLSAVDTWARFRSTSYTCPTCLNPGGTRNGMIEFRYRKDGSPDEVQLIKSAVLYRVPIQFITPAAQPAG
ncbi:hypothetical protein OIU78_027830 [Salix suchowensis]|nr:hypothetical protein OIU78_027830 [Salix suchowensis]